ncbi:uncharacterized protein MCYG_02306 [Microsporum canis CBS 113480]|uniref:Uncharacterized protein n=1 Tax=Arthroderma otae (strain ATCC MYA-4605 / CBS 113480) TaxID=554155 RepID=C5FFP0_ARTOC|nr:uncharacterized protein MCYG_02306 [Microsporum canis CBS 113480]EEQ29487.1 predicted protein [Microsporum canis CBS 113480]
MGNWLLDKKRWRKIGHNSTRTLIHSSTQSPGLRREPPFGDQVRLPRTNTIPWTSGRGIEAAPARIANLTSHESEGMQKSTEKRLLNILEKSMIAALLAKRVTDGKQKWIMSWVA